jgi:hypothetical protein
MPAHNSFPLCESDCRERIELGSLLEPRSKAKLRELLFFEPFRRIRAIYIAHSYSDSPLPVIVLQEVDR